MMKYAIFLLMLLANFVFAQANKDFQIKFLQGEKLKKENFLARYNHFDFSGIWTQTENYLVFGIIGEEHQRIKIKLLSVVKNAVNPGEYLVSGKSNVKGNICDFKGTINLKEIKEFKENKNYKDSTKLCGDILAFKMFHEFTKSYRAGVNKEVIA